MPVVVVSGKVYRLLVERSGACAVNLFRHGEVDGAAHISEGGVATLALYLAEAEGAEVDDVEVEDIYGAVCEAGVFDIGDGIDTQREMQQVNGELHNLRVAHDDGAALGVGLLVRERAGAYLRPYAGRVAHRYSEYRFHVLG